MNICIIGAGATGLTLAYELQKKGHAITIFETEPKLGGLVNTLEIGGTKLETFYHHIFTSDSYIIDLINELGLSDKLEWIPPSNAIYINNKIYPFTTPLDLLKFGELSFVDRILMGMLVYKAKFIKSHENLDYMKAREWIIKNSSNAVYEKVWGPLLNSKFDKDAENICATWIWNKFKLRGSTRGKNISKELLGYMNGSFGIIYETLEKNILKNNGKILYSQPVSTITKNPDNTFNVLAGDFNNSYDKVICTSAPENLLKIVDGFDENYINKIRNIKYKSNICMILELSMPLSNYYWTTVADDTLPFVAVIEQSNLIRDNRYSSNIIYLSRYIDSTDELYDSDDSTIKETFINGLKKIYKDFNEDSIRNLHISKTKFAQPVVSVGYSGNIPDFNTPIDNLYIVSMAQIYPEDRGQNYAIRMAKQFTTLL